MKEWLIKKLNNRVIRFLFILALFTIGTSTLIGSLYLLIALCMKYGMIAYAIFAFIIFAIISFILSKKRI